ncbi:hypothetical protein HK11_09385 [Acetobacter sp. DmW_043]|nr:hypothetical protein HK11_09385 [Acetobacter sp. DmW_043]
MKNKYIFHFLYVWSLKHALVISCVCMVWCCGGHRGGLNSRRAVNDCCFTCHDKNMLMKKRLPVCAVPMIKPTHSRFYGSCLSVFFKMRGALTYQDALS